MIKILLFLLIVSIHCFPNTIWVYNEKPIEDSLLIIQLQYKRIQHLLPDWSKQVVTSHDAKKYVTLPSSSGTILKNLMKLSVLDKFGGVWIDLSGILIENLNWLTQLDSNKAVTHKSGNKPKIFVFDQSRSSKTQTLKQGFTLQTSFIAAQANNSLLQETLKVYINMIQSNKVMQNIQPKAEEGVSQLYDDNDELVLVQAFRRVLSQSNKIIEEFGLWTINADDGPTQYMDKSSWQEKKILPYLSLVKQEKVDRNKKSRYFARMKEHQTLVLNLFLDDNMSLWQRIKILLKGYKQGELTKFLCNQNYFKFANSSVIDRFLIGYDKELVQKFQSKVQIKKIESNYICQIQDMTGNNQKRQAVAMGIIICLIFLHSVIAKLLIYLAKLIISFYRKWKKQEKINKIRQITK